MENFLFFSLIFLFFLFFYGIPIILTIFNLINLFKKNPVKEALIDALTMILGIYFSLILFRTLWANKDYQYSLNKLEETYHTPIASEHMLTIILLILISLLGYFLLRIRGKKLSPILATVCISSMYMGNILSLIFIIQLSKNIFNLTPLSFENIGLMMLFPLNYILCSIRLIRRSIDDLIHKANNNEYNNKLLKTSKYLLTGSLYWYVLAFIFMAPILVISFIVLTIFGQQPDAVIKAFTDTSDWTLSQKLSPPPVEYDDHYLCTVALQGHKQIVKPTRCGIRRGTKIIVNRQLCIANAFEEYIGEKLPRFHRILRNFYDKYGYPLSKNINTEIEADIVYVLMKPLEWIFLVFLYTFDEKPENRISLQYTKKC